MTLSNADTALLMRSLLRSLPQTPEREQDAHNRLYNRLTAHYVDTCPPEQIKAVGNAIDHHMGR